MNKIENAELSDRAVNQISDVIIPMIKKRDKEIERLNNIIKEVREYIEDKKNIINLEFEYVVRRSDILEILDKGE